MSQDQLAALLSVRSGKQTISNWEKGRSEPALTEIRRIAEVFETSVGRLLDPAVVEDKSPCPPPGYVLILADELIDMQRKLLNMK